MMEIANAQDQLDLLRLIIDNTWSAIRQQANAQAKQQASKASVPKSVRPKAIKPLKHPPYAAPPKPLPKPKVAPTQLAKQQQANQAQLVNQINKSLSKPRPISSIQPTKNPMQQMGSA